jgi:catalase
VSGPARPAKSSWTNPDAATAKFEDTNSLVAALPSNPNKPGEYGEAATAPQPRPTGKPDSPAVTASTLTEATASAKVGTGKPNLGFVC